MDKDNKEFDYQIHAPGKWLDNDLTEQESKDIVEYAVTVSEIKTNPEDAVNRISAQISQLSKLNSVMHLLYKLNKDKLHLYTTEDGVVDADGMIFDMVAYTLGFATNSLTESNQLSERLQEISLPDKTASPLDRVTKLLFSNSLPIDKPVKVDSGTALIKQPNGKVEKTKIAPIVTISLQDLPPGIELSRDIEPFDNEVFRAICALQDAGNKRFTGHDIYRVMTGNQNGLATTETLQMIDTSWKRLTSIAMKMDTGNMGDAYNFVKWIRNRRIIEGGDDTLIVRNQYGHFQSTVYTLNEEPILKTYAAHLGQIGRYPSEWLNTPVNKTPELLILQTALFDHIQAIPNISNHIVYETLFNRINIDAPNAAAERKKKAKLRSHIHRMLDYWKECGVINDWHEEKQGNSIYCIVIDKPKRKKLTDRPPKKVGTTP